MKGNISLGDFIRDVKRELVEAQDKSGDPFFELAEVQLEVSFVLDTTARAGGKLLVVELGGETKAQQTHKVSLKLQPIAKADVVVAGTASRKGSSTQKRQGGAGGMLMRRPKYR